jgi:hypothetical protein
MEIPLPTVGKEFFLMGMCLPSCSLATDIMLQYISPEDPQHVAAMWFYNVFNNY